LRRTESYICLTDLQSLPSSSSSLAGSSTAPVRDSYSAPPVSNARSMRQCREKRERRKAYLNYTDSNPTAFSSPRGSGPSIPLPPTPDSQPKQYPASVSAHRISSPLSPVRTVLPARPVFPRSKHEPDLYKQAITTRMRCSPEGQKILHMGPRLALSIMTATQDLERLVAGQSSPSQDVWDSDRDVVMSDAPTCTTTSCHDPTASLAGATSWIVLHNEDWEMVDCISA